MSSDLLWKKIFLGGGGVAYLQLYKYILAVNMQIIFY